MIARVTFYKKVRLPNIAIAKKSGFPDLSSQQQQNRFSPCLLKRGKINPVLAWLKVSAR